MVEKFKEIFSEKLNSLNLPTPIKEQIIALAVDSLKELPQTAECSPELLSAVEAAVAKVAAELQRELERKMEEVGKAIVEVDNHNATVLAEVIGESEGRIRAKVELAKDEIKDEIRTAKDEIIKDQQDLAYLNSRSW